MSESPVVGGAKRKRDDEREKGAPCPLPSALAYIDAVRRARRADELAFTFEEAYSAVFKAVTAKHGQALFAAVARALRWMAARRTRAEHEFGAKVLGEVCLYLFCKWAPVHLNVHSVRELALRAWHRPALRAWRRLRALARLGGLVVRCRAAFDEVRFRPGGSAVAALRADFERRAVEVVEAVGVGGAP